MIRLFSKIPQELKRWSIAQKFLLLFAVGFFLVNAFYGFPDSPAPWFDPGINLGISRTYAEDGVFTLRLSPGKYVQNRPLMTSSNYPLFWPLIASFKLFGVGLAQAQIVMILYAILFFSVVFTFIKKHYSTTAALLGLILGVTFLPLYGHGLSGGLGEISGLTFLFLGLLFIPKKKPWQIFVCGLFFGIAASAKVFYLLTIGALGVSELYRAIRERKLPVKRWFLLGVGIIIPLLVWLRTLLPEGLSWIGARQALNYYRNPYDVAGTVGDNIIKFFTESTLLHFTVLSAVFVIYLIIKLRQSRVDHKDILLFVFVFLNIFFFLRTPGWFRYIFPAHLTLLVLFPSFLYYCVENYSSTKKYKNLAAALIIFLIVAQSAHLLLNRNDRIYYNPAPRVFAERLDSELGSNVDLFVVDKPEMWFLLKSTSTRQYINVNPYIQLGENVFATGNLPEYIVSGEPEANEYLRNNLESLRANYERVDQHGSYVLFKLNIAE